MLNPEKKFTFLTPVLCSLCATPTPVCYPQLSVVAASLGILLEGDSGQGLSLQWLVCQSLLRDCLGSGCHTSSCRMPSLQYLASFWSSVSTRQRISSPSPLSSSVGALVTLCLVHLFIICLLVAQELLDGRDKLELASSKHSVNVQFLEI